MAIIESKNVSFDYIRRDENGNVEGITRAVDDVSLKIEQGDFIAILGHNGSGKSTFAKHLNAILYPTEGSVWVDGKDTRQDENIWDVRQSAGSTLVFREIDGILQFAYIVVECSGTHFDAVCADASGRFGRKVAHLH